VKVRATPLKIGVISSVSTRDMEAEVGSGPFSVEAEARKFYRLGFHIGYLI